MKNNFISRNHPFWGTYIGDFGDFHGDLSAKNPIITVRFGKYRCVLVFWCVPVFLWTAKCILSFTNISRYKKEIFSRRKDGTKFSCYTNYHVQTFCKYRKNNECETISIMLTKNHSRDFSNRKILKMHALVFEKMCSGPRRDKKKKKNNK